MGEFESIFRNMMVGDLMDFNPCDSGRAVSTSRCVGRRLGRSYEISECGDGSVTVRRRD